MTTPQPDPQHLLAMLTSAVQLLAADPDEQVATLPDFVHVPDELAQNFDDTYVLAPQIHAAGLLDERAMRALEPLNQSLEGISAWTLEAVRADPEWASVRAQARAALQAMGAARGPIDLSWGAYVPGKTAD